MSRVQVRKWPIPFYNPRWLFLDPIRIDALLGITVGIVCVQILATTTSKTLLILFGICFTIQLVRATMRLMQAYEVLLASKYGKLKIISLGIAICGLIASMVFFPLFALVVVVFFFLVRIGTLMIRDDRVLLIVAAVLWLLSTFPALFSLRFCWSSTTCSPAEILVPPAVGGLTGLFVALCCSKNGFRIARFPMAVLESTTLVFGIFLAAASVLRSAVFALSSPGVSNAQDLGHVSAIGNTEPSGSRTIWVTDHVRTMPDQTTANNISSGNPGKVNPNQIQISAYKRTLPDGILSNNLSATSSQATPGYLLNESANQVFTSSPPSGLKNYSVSFVSGFASLVMAVDIRLRDDVAVRSCRNKLTKAFWCWIPATKSSN
jgi:hypothetical protein